MIPALKFLMYPNAMTDKFYLEEAIEDLHTLLDMTRWATSRFNDAALYFGQRPPPQIEVKSRAASSPSPS